MYMYVKETRKCVLSMYKYQEKSLNFLLTYFKYLMSVSITRIIVYFNNFKYSGFITI